MRHALVDPHLGMSGATEHKPGMWGPGMTLSDYCGIKQ